MIFLYLTYYIKTWIVMVKLIKFILIKKKLLNILSSNLVSLFLYTHLYKYQIVLSTVHTHIYIIYIRLSPHVTLLHFVYTSVIFYVLSDFSFPWEQRKPIYFEAEKEKIKNFLIQKKVSQATRDYIEVLKKQAKIKTYF